MFRITYSGNLQSHIVWENKTLTDEEEHWVSILKIKDRDATNSDLEMWFKSLEEHKLKNIQLMQFPGVQIPFFLKDNAEVRELIEKIKQKVS